MLIEQKNIINTIAQQLMTINSQHGYGLEFVVEDEQAFIKENDKYTDKIYVVVRFNRASTNLGRSVLPVNLTIFGYPNEIATTQEFFTRFIETYNLNVDGDTTQLWMSPEVILNFNSFANEYRSLFTVSGTFLIGNGTLRLDTLQYFDDEKDDYVNIPIIGFIDVTEASLNPQPYPDSYGRTKSYGSFITNAFTIILYPDYSLKLIRDVMSWKYDFNTNHQNDIFTFKLNFSQTFVGNGQSSDWKCRSANFSQKIGDIPTIELTFSR